MQEQLITFETAQLAQEKGFSENVDFCYDSEEKSLEDPYVYNVGDLSGDDELYAPTQSLLQKWLREVHGIYVNSEHDLNPKGNGILYNTNWGFINAPTKDSRNVWYRTGGGYSENEEFKTYEEALEIGLQEALKLI